LSKLKTGICSGPAPEENGWTQRRLRNQIKPGTVYSVYSLTERIGETKGGKPAPLDEPCLETQMLKLSPKIERGVIALAAPWNALPRKVQIIDPTQEVYVDAVRDFLITKGIEQPKVKIDNILRVDLDSDGEEEVLISATNYFSKDDRASMRSPAGSYSMVLLRRVVAEKWEHNWSKVNSTRRLMSGGTTRSTRRMLTR
jgi:hypothetical protein